MRNAFIAIATILLSSLSLLAMDGLSVQPDKATYNKAGLLITVALVDNAYGFLEEWKKPSLADTPIVKTKTKFNRGEIVFPAITYSTDALDAEGKANISFDILFLRPDGSSYVDEKNKIVVNGIPPKGIGLLQDQVALKIEDHDPYGKYKIRIKVTDKNKKVSVEIPMEFEVVP
jgi:hypothetical protein